MAKSTSKMNWSGGAAIWVYNPWLDLLVGCGAWSAPLLLFSYLADSTALTWMVAFYGLALFFNYPHYMATLYRAYHTAEDFRKYRVFTVHVTALILLTLVVSHFWYRMLPWIFTFYLTWSPWHYSGQNYGLFMMFARRAGAKPSQIERRVLYAVFLVSYAILFLSFHTGPSTDPLFLSLAIPGKMGLALVIVLGVAFLILSVFGWSRLLRQTGWRPLIPSLTLFSTQCMWFLLPTALALGEGLPITQSRYSNGVLAVMHSAQYLWITSYYARREANAETGRQWRPLAYFGVLIAGGIALFVPGPWLASRLFHYDFTASFLLFTALVNIHHFVLDGAIWKLRDGRIAALLLNSREKLANATSRAGDGLAAGTRWFLGNSFLPRTARVSASVLLLAWGTVDQVRYYYALHRENIADLQRAAVLDSFDSSLQMRLANAELEKGKDEEAVTAWRQAIRASPASAAPRDALLKYLTDHQRFGEAYTVTGQSLRYTPKDVNLLVNRGILAQHLGRSDEAVAVWNKAIALDPKQTLVHVYLGGELEREGKLDAAISHYMIFLQQAAKSGGQYRMPAPDVIAVVLRLAQCQQKANHFDQAPKSYELAQAIASRTGQAKLESFASASQAGLAAQRKNISEALRLYQHALYLDRSGDDRRSEATDWYSYGLFLRDSGFPTRLSYACLVRSELLMSSLDDQPDLKQIAALREEVGSKLGAEAATLQRHPQPALEEALVVSGH
jgi:tetratricopeptide (TPR) repeat protein